MIDRQITEPPVARKQREFKSEMEDDEDDIDESGIDTSSENQQVSAKKIMRALGLHRRDLVSWNADGDVSIHGQPLERVNFTDLVTLLCGMVRSRPSKNIPQAYEKILGALAEANIPESVIEKKTALNQYRALKHDNE